MKIANWSRQQVFRLMHSNNLVYNQCWEDPRLDRQALKIKNSDNLLMLTSAGCNALNYLLDNPKRIDAVDMNPRQNALLQLKMAAIRELDHGDFFQLFGRGYHLKASEIYHDALRSHLDDYSQNYWDENIGLFRPSQLSPGFYFRGTAGWVARFLGEYIHIKGLFPSLDRAFRAQNIEEQSAIYYEELKPHFWNRLLRWTTRRAVMMSALGVPRCQFLQVEEHYPGGMARFIEDGLDAVFARLSLKDNYFYHLYLFGHYSEDCAPDYLLAQNFETLKERVGRVQTHTMSVLDFVQQCKHKIHKATLLDHMDWLYAKHKDVLHKQWQQLVELTEVGSRFIWRSASLKVDFIDPIPLRDGRSLSSILKYDLDLSQRLHQLDRVHTYGSFSIAEVNP
jgi:S-adenosylmethionine-diacylglycerol 3-amino-3-carboxypropyl transferase